MVFKNGVEKRSGAPVSCYFPGCAARSSVNRFTTSVVDSPLKKPKNDPVTKNCRIERVGGTVWHLFEAPRNIGKRTKIERKMRGVNRTSRDVG